VSLNNVRSTIHQIFTLHFDNSIMVLSAIKSSLKEEVSEDISEIINSFERLRLSKAFSKCKVNSQYIIDLTLFASITLHFDLLYITLRAGYLISDTNVSQKHFSRQSLGECAPLLTIQKCSS